MKDGIYACPFLDCFFSVFVGWKKFPVQLFSGLDCTDALFLLTVVEEVGKMMSR